MPPCRACGFCCARPGGCNGTVEHERGCAALTLTTFTEVPWNGPYYRRCGFRVLGDAELTPGLRKIRAAEAEHGLDRWPRACLRRELGPE